MDTEILKDLGLTNTEIKVYLTLLEIGSAPAGTILEKSHLPNSTVHRDLNSLIEKSLVNFILEGKRKIYHATNPEHFFEFIEEKKRKFQEILPELKKKQDKQLKKETAGIYKGIRGIKEVYNTMINAKGKEYNTFGGGHVTVEIMTLTWWENLHKRRVANKLPSRQVFDMTVKPDAGGIESNPITNIRYVDKEFAQFQETVIVGDYVAIAVFTKENPYAFLIKDKAVADSYRKHFELLWKSSAH